MKLLKTLDKIIGSVVMAAGILDMVALFVILTMNVIIRIFSLPVIVSWYSEVVEILFAWMVMLGAVLLCRNNDHFRVDLFLQKYSEKRGYYWLEAACYCVSLAFCVYFMYFGYTLAAGASQTMPILRIPKGFAYSCMPISAALMCVYSVRDIVVSVGRALGKIPVIEVKKVS